MVTKQDVLKYKQEEIFDISPSISSLSHLVKHGPEMEWSMYALILLLPGILCTNYVPDEYIVELGPFLTARDIENRIPGAKVNREFHIGPLDYASITVDAKHHDAVYNDENYDIDLIPNVIIDGFSDKCYKQHTGSTFWGLTRLSHVDLPDFSKDDSYKFR